MKEKCCKSFKEGKACRSCPVLDAMRRYDGSVRRRDVHDHLIHLELKAKDILREPELCEALV